jgi:hypothetical protein
MKTHATRVRKPQTASVTGETKAHATRLRKSETTRVTQVMPPRTAALAANSATRSAWVITTTKLAGMRPSRKRVTVSAARAPLRRTVRSYSAQPAVVGLGVRGPRPGARRGKRGASAAGVRHRRFMALSLSAGLRQVRLHDLRHGAMSLMWTAGVPMAIVSKMLRRSSIGITVDTEATCRSRRRSPPRTRTAHCWTRRPSGPLSQPATTRTHGAPPRGCEITAGSVNAQSTRWAPWGSNPQPAD